MTFERLIIAVICLFSAPAQAELPINQSDAMASLMPILCVFAILIGVVVFLATRK